MIDWSIRNTIGLFFFFCLPATRRLQKNFTFARGETETHFKSTIRGVSRGSTFSTVRSTQHPTDEKTPRANNFITQSSNLHLYK